MAIIPGIDSIISAEMGAAELGARGAMRLSQTWWQVSPRLVKWGLSRKRPPASEVRDLFESLGATYIKFGQFIASSPSVFPPDYVEEFQKLLDQTAAIPFSKIKHTLEQELAQPLDEIFLNIDRQAMASASIAQVHAATLRSGEDVVIKVQKPGVQAIISVDLHSVYIITRIFEVVLPSLDRDALTGLVAEMYQSMIDECDFRKEARNLDAFREFLQASNNSAVVAPKPYHHASSAKILTMERLDGVAFTDSELRNSFPGDPAAALEQALSTWFASLTQCDFFHADLHSGNLLLLNDGRVGFIDFGMVGRIQPETWAAAFSLFTGLEAGDYAQIAQAMIEVGLTRDEVDADALAQDIEKVVKALDQGEPAYAASAVSGQTDGVSELMAKLGEIARQYGIRFPRSFTMLLKQFLYFDRYLQLVAPNMGLFDGLVEGE